MTLGPDMLLLLARIRPVIELQRRRKLDGLATDRLANLQIK